MSKPSPSSAGIPSGILCSADLTARPPGISALEFLTAKYEAGRGIKSALTRKVEAATNGPTASAVGSVQDRFLAFVKTGTLAGELSQADARRMLDMSRAALLARPSATATPAPAPAPATARTISAAEFTGPPPPSMLRSEFNKLTDSNRSKFIRDGGKLVADPTPARR